MAVHNEEIIFIKRKVLRCTIAAFFCIATPLVLIAVDPMFIIAKHNFRLENGTILHELLSAELECAHMEVFLFNVTNAERFMAGEDQKMKIEEIGPFTYIEYRKNEDLEFTDGVMRYTPRFRAEFVPEQSIGNPEDMMVTMPNIPMMCALSLLTSYPKWVQNLFNMLTTPLGLKAMVSQTAKDYIWGYPDPVLSLANKVAPGLIHFDTVGVMDRLFDKNTYYRLELGATDEDKFSVKTVKEFRIIKSGNQETTIESTVNFTNTYEGIAYPPLLDSETPINIYRVGICKTFNLVVTGSTTSKYGPEAFVYGLIDAPFRERTLCNSKGFCPNGLVDMSPCFFGLPLALSKGHFLDGDPELLKNFEGLKPNRTIHDTHMTIEPRIGLTLDARLSVQVNLVLGDLSYHPAAKPLSDIVLPIAHFLIKQSKLPDIAIKALTLMYITMPKVFQAVQIVFIAVGVLILCYTLRLLHQIHFYKPANMPRDKKSLDVKYLKAQIPLIGRVS